MKPSVKRFVSLSNSLFDGKWRSEIVQAASRFLSKHDLAGIELRVNTNEDLLSAPPLCEVYIFMDKNFCLCLLFKLGALLPGNYAFVR